MSAPNNALSLPIQQEHVIKDTDVIFSKTGINLAYEQRRSHNGGKRWARAPPAAATSAVQHINDFEISS